MLFSLLLGPSTHPIANCGESEVLVAIAGHVGKDLVSAIQSKRTLLVLQIIIFLYITVYNGMGLLFLIKYIIH